MIWYVLRLAFNSNCFYVVQNNVSESPLRIGRSALVSSPPSSRREMASEMTEDCTEDVGEEPSLPLSRGER